MNGALFAETEKERPLEVLTADFTMDAARENYTDKAIGGLEQALDEWLRKGVNVYAYCKHEMPANAGLRAWAASAAVT